MMFYMKSPSNDGAHWKRAWCTLFNWLF